MLVVLFNSVIITRWYIKNIQVPPPSRVRLSMCTPVIPVVPYLLLGLQDVQWTVRNSRTAHKLARTTHVNQKKKKTSSLRTSFSFSRVKNQWSRQSRFIEEIMNQWSRQSRFIEEIIKATNNKRGSIMIKLLNKTCLYGEFIRRIREKIKNIYFFLTSLGS